MSSRIAKVWICAKEFKHEVQLDNFELIEEELKPIDDDEFIAEAIFLSVDPYQRTLQLQFPVKSVISGRQVARIIESKNVNFPVGKLVFCNCGWRTLTLINIKNFPNRHDLYLLPDEMNSFSPSFALGCFGNPGNSAFYGFFELCQPQKRDVVVVSGAAGAVGSLVGQLSKIKECKMVIGFAGSDEKCRWLETEMGFDKAINYKNDNVKEELKKAAPDGVDCYFDNVGGVLSSIVIGDNMRMFGRISVCGSISNYNDNTILVPAFNKFHRQNLRMEGFMNYRWIKKWLDEGMFEMIQYVKDGKIKCQETITEHFENTPQAFVDMMRGKNFGKAIVKI